MFISVARSAGEAAMNHSRFEWAVQGARSGPDIQFDIDLYEFPTVAVLPTKGSMVSGWLLLIPRTKAASIQQLPPSARLELMRVRSLVETDLQRFGNDHLFWFEHGPGVVGSPLGCGVDQAHLHVIPLPFDLVGASARAEPAFTWSPVNATDPWCEIKCEHDYLLVSNGTGTFLTYPAAGISQFFRKVIASELNRGIEWNYRVYPNADAARETVRRIGSARPAP